MRKATLILVILLSGCIDYSGVNANQSPVTSPTDKPNVPSPSNGGGSSTGGATPTNTEEVLSYVTTRHANVVPQFVDAEKAVLRSASANGSLLGSSTLKKSGDAYVSTIQSFLNDSVNYAKEMNVSQPVDKAALKNALNSYRSQDISYISQHYTGAVWNNFPTNSIVSAVGDVSNRINSAYDLALHFPF